MTRALTPPSVSAQPRSHQHTQPLQIALCGNPNCGKSTIFNLLTGLSQKVANYPGVTVERKSGPLVLESHQSAVELIDVPGTYSLAAHSPDEAIAAQALFGSAGQSVPDLIVYVLDASALERGLYLLLQVLQVDRPVVIALNMTDVSVALGVSINLDSLREQVGSAAVVPMIASKGKGLSELKAAIRLALQSTYRPRNDYWPYGEDVQKIVRRLQSKQVIPGSTPAAYIRALFDDTGPIGAPLASVPEAHEARHQLAESYGALMYAETAALTEAASNIAASVTTRAGLRPVTLSQKIDRWVLHPVVGPLALLAMMTLMFQSIFTWSEPLMSLIDQFFGQLAGTVGGLMPAGPLQSLVTDGLIGGVGSVIIFLPQIVILFLFIAFLEDSGYMPRAALLVDRLFGWCGLSGKSFIPMLSSFACAIPGIMACRTIEDKRVRLLTIMVSPLMSCSARLPVYTIMIAAFIPATPTFGLFNLQGIVLLTLYLLGTVVAVLVAVVVHRLLLRRSRTHFLMELPSYRLPTVRSIFLRVYQRATAFLLRAGTVILAITILIWALSYYPRSEAIIDQFEMQRQIVLSAPAAAGTESQSAQLANIDQLEAGALLRDSYFGRIGQAIEPIFVPLGWDWKITMAALASFPAREVVIATLGAIYNIGSDIDETSGSLIEQMQQATWESGPQIGTAVFTPAVALSIMVFFALCCQCGATVATIKQESGHWGYAFGAFAYMTILAYVASFVVFQSFRAIGW